MNNFFNHKEKLEKDIKREIKRSYKKVSNDFLKRLATVNADSITYEYLRLSAKYLENEYKKLNKRVNKSTEKAIISTIEAYTSTQLELYSDLCPSIGRRWEDMFIRINEIVLENVITGRMYGDNIKLSERLWSNHKKTTKTINEILTDGFVAKKNAKDIAKDLEIYINPDFAKDYDLFTIHPKSKNKIEFNSYRLASTYINHSYQAANKESARKNPYVEKIQWLSGTDNRVCDLCQERDGQLFDKNDIPFDHPLGRCTYVHVLEKDLDVIARELRAWSNGMTNTKLDAWFNEYGA